MDAEESLTHPLLLSFRSRSILQVLPVGLESADDIERRTVLSTLSRSDGSSVDHQSRTVESTESHQNTGHILIASRDDDHSVKPVSSSSGFDLVGDEVSRLELEGREEREERKPR